MGASSPDGRFRWGIIATGNIAASMAEALGYVRDAELLAVASRSLDSANAFGEKWGAPHRYGSYGELMADPDVDIVYVATPHSSHHENVMAALAAGKHVLCEKPLTLNAAQAAECVAFARERSLFLMEAVWMRFFPVMARVRDLVADGVIGDIEIVQADFCRLVPFDPSHRLYDPRLGGGALLDLGIYPLSFAMMLLGRPTQIHGEARLGATGVDESNALTLTFPGGALAQLTSSFRGTKPYEACVVGSRGRIEVRHPFFCPERMTVHRDDAELEDLVLPARGNGYVHEVEEVHRCLQSGLVESSVMPLDETVAAMALMDSLRLQWGVSYPGE